MYIVCSVCSLSSFRDVLPTQRQLQLSKCLYQARWAENVGEPRMLLVTSSQQHCLWFRYMKRMKHGPSLSKSYVPRSLWIYTIYTSIYIIDIIWYYSIVMYSISYKSIHLTSFVFYRCLISVRWSSSQSSLSSCHALRDVSESRLVVGIKLCFQNLPDNVNICQHMSTYVNMSSFQAWWLHCCCWHGFLCWSIHVVALEIKPLTESYRILQS